MREQVLIRGIGQSEIERVLQKLIRHDLESDPDNSITRLQLLVSRTDNSFVLRPNKFCSGWDFLDLCCKLKEAFVGHKEAQLQGWFELLEDTMNGLPTGKMMYVRFDGPKPDDVDIIDSKGNLYEYYIYTYEESDEEELMAEIAGTADFVPYPKKQLSSLPDGQGVFDVGAVDRRKAFGNFIRRNKDTQWFTLVWILLLCPVLFFSIGGGWSFSETVLPFSLPDWVPFAVFGAMGLLLTLWGVTFRKYNFWGRLIYNTMVSAMAVGLMMAIVFTTNRWLSDKETIAGTGIVTRHVIEGRNNDTHNYYVDVIAPKEGKIFVRMQYDASFCSGDTVQVNLHSGFFGMMYAESISHR